jgi:hypothetical protein
MRYRPYGKKRKFSIIPVIKVTFFSISYSLLIVGGFSAGAAIVSSLTASLTTISTNK